MHVERHLGARVVYACTDAWMHGRMHACTDACTHAGVHADMHADVHAGTHADVHACRRGESVEVRDDVAP